MPRKQTPACASQAIAPKPTRQRLPEPLPRDLLGRRLCQLFPYPWQAIVASTPADASQKPAWQTLTQYPLKPRSLWTYWQDTAQLVGVRFGPTTYHGLIDLDALSLHHPTRDRQALATIRAALASIGIHQTILLRSSWNGGLHLYIPLPEAVPTFGLAVALKHCLEAHHLPLQAGQLEVFPNVKRYTKAGEYSEYNAHRLPLQPSSGSVLFSETLQPLPSDLSSFFQQWDQAAAAQNLEQLHQAIAQAKKQHQYRSYNRRSNTALWQQELETEMAQGWTGSGQTNHLLKTIGCYGVVFQSLSGAALSHYIEHTAIKSPGYQEWCQHQHEISRRAQEWATAVENYYWPLGSSPKRGRSLSLTTAANNIVNFNQKRAEDAKARIKQAVLELTQQGQLPDRPTARAQAIASLAQCSHTTLQKHKELWHPERCVMELQETVTAPSRPPATGPTKALEEPPREELHTFTYMKGEGHDAVLEKQISSHGEGAGRGEMSFPQPSVLPPEPSTSPPVIAYDDLIDVIVGIQIQVRQLGWSVEQVHQFIADKFYSKRRSQLTDDELVCLLYRLRTHTLSEAKN
ncbi:MULTISPECIES: hypothetical protein [Trichocoleus]|uniref:Primase C-terminal 1 domain-containing protein n=1 Tax=Trichocoleus desertorum GB2-A4 TaxID=2933944 RepID=A0ABV0JDZ8_9CYAN|nr:hypothetical protein [Trichocoleus sp. FACHB-46]MBD1865194.1 hypothetical protein [Trichocoleus sp. FACHB-46]